MTLTTRFPFWLPDCQTFSLVIDWTFARHLQTRHAANQPQLIPPYQWHFVRRNHNPSVHFPHKGPVTQNCIDSISHFSRHFSRHSFDDRWPTGCPFYLPYAARPLTLHRRNTPSAILPSLAALIGGAFICLPNPPLPPGYCSAGGWVGAHQSHQPTVLDSLWSHLW